VVERLVHSLVTQSWSDSIHIRIVRFEAWSAEKPAGRPSKQGEDTAGLARYSVA